MASNAPKIVVENKEWEKLIELCQSSWEKRANISPICYSFNYLCLNHINFNLTQKIQRWRLISFIETITNLSKETSETIYKLNHCHSIKDSKIKEFKLQPLVNCSDNKTLYSFGNSSKPIRLLGFFDKDKPYLFHVCLIDWNHKLYPRKNYVYD